MSPRHARIGIAMRRTSAAVAVLLLAACTSTHHAPKSSPDSILPASQSAPASTAGAPAASGSNGPATQAGIDNPGQFASDLQFTDVSAKVNSALGNTNGRKLSFARATLTVPLDWTHPANGKTVAIVVLRVRSASQHNRIGSLLVNPGGPGGSGVDLALSLAASGLPTSILDRFDIVGFDPRGVGLSSPITCIPAKQKDAELQLSADPLTDAAWQASLADTQQVANECYTAYGADLTYYSTAETARDMEALRAKLGDPKLTYLGYSYGTLLGAEYASAYPNRVRALVLDGAVDPTLSTVDSDRIQAAGFQLAFSHFASACTSAGHCQLGKDPQQFVLNLERQADAHPIGSGDSSDPRTVRGGAVLLAVISALYDQTQWGQLTQALADAAHGNGSGVLILDDQYNQRNPDGTYSNIEDSNAAISCADTPNRPSVAQARALQPQWRAANPLFGGSAASSLSFCSVWKAPADAPITISNHHAPTVLVVGTTGDPATPISGAHHLTSLLGTADLLVWQGDGHTAYPKTPCITTDVDSYLIDLKAPPAGTTCPAGNPTSG